MQLEFPSSSVDSVWTLKEAVYLLHFAFGIDILEWPCLK